MVKKSLTLLDLTGRLAHLKEHKQQLHTQLIETKRLIRSGVVVESVPEEIRKQIAQVQTDMRQLERSISLMTIMLVQQAVVEETPYGHVIKHDNLEDKTQETE